MYGRVSYLIDARLAITDSKVAYSVKTACDPSQFLLFTFDLDCGSTLGA